MRIVRSRRATAVATAMAMAMAALLAAGCAEVRDIPVVQQLEGTPTQVVGRALSQVAARNLGGASISVCPELRAPDRLPMPLGALFLHLTSLDVSDARRLEVMTLDFGGLTAKATMQDDDNAVVSLHGPVGVRFDRDRVRRLALEATGGQDAAEVDRIMAVTGAGEFTVALDRTVQLVRMDGTWFICDPSAVDEPVP